MLGIKGVQRVQDSCTLDSSDVLDSVSNSRGTPLGGGPRLDTGHVGHVGQVGLGRNRHPVDELADVREELRKLKVREDELRAEILSGDHGLVGDQFEASVRETSAERIDTGELKKRWGMDKLQPFVRTSSTTTIRVTPRQELDDVG